MNQPKGGFSFLDMFGYSDMLKNYNPWTNWQRFFNPQFFINCNTEDAEVENQVLSQVGSYGMQVGQIIDALDILISRLPHDKITPQERETLQRFRALSQEVDAAVASVKGPQSKGITLRDVDRLVSQLDALERSDQATYHLLVEHIGKLTQGSNENTGPRASFSNLHPEVSG